MRCCLRRLPIVLALGLALAACSVGCGQGDENELQGTWVTPPNELTKAVKRTWTFEEGKIIHDDGARMSD